MIINNPADCDLVCMTIIAGRKIKDPLLDALLKGEARLINVEYGTGSTHVNSLSEIFGFRPEKKKVVVFCLMRRDASVKMLEVLDKDFCFNEPNTGIAYTIAVEELSF